MIQLQGHTSTTGRSQRLGFKHIRHFIEALRQEHVECEEGFAVIAISCAPTKSRSIERIVSELDDLDDLLKANWAHEKQLGWLSPDRLAIVLPNAAPLDAWQYRDQIRNYCGFPHDAISVYAGNQSVVQSADDQGAVCVPSVDALLTQSPPSWKRLFDVAGSMFGDCLRGARVSVSCPDNQGDFAWSNIVSTAADRTGRTVFFDVQAADDARRC